MTTTVSTPLLSFEERLNTSPITRTMWLLWALSAAIIALDGFDFFIIGVALPFLQRDFHLTSAQIGAVAVAAMVGSMVGAFTLGPITDQVGRQRMLMVDVAIFVLATAGTALAWDTTSLIFFRFLAGVGIGADYPISVSFITENVPANRRGRMVVGAYGFQGVGTLLGGIIGLTVIQFFQIFYPESPLLVVQYGWRWMLGLGLILAVAVGILRNSFLLESPLYHIHRKEYDQASKSASMLLDEPIHITPESDPPKPESNLSYSSLFSRPYLRRTILASVPWFFKSMVAWGISIFTPTIINALAFTTQGGFLAQEKASVTGCIFVNIFLIVGFLVAVLWVERVGRIRLQIVGFIGMAAGLLILAASHLFSGTETSVILVFVGFLIYNFTMTSGPDCTVYLLSGELFPSSIRGSGAGFASGFAQVGAIIGTFALPILHHAIGLPALLCLQAAICLIAAVCTSIFRVETTGKTLESVEVK